MDPTPKLLVVCAHNRTRSVIAAALMHRAATEAGIEIEVSSAGVAAEGLPATAPAVQLLDRLGIDIDSHRSTLVTRDAVFGADLVVTAEADQVVWISGRWPDAYRRTFTLPEVVDYLQRTGARVDAPMGEWVVALSRCRPPSKAYLEHGRIPGIEDPTGHRPETWERVVEQMQGYCTEVIGALAERVRSTR
jgi:protein-tyrosine-phosphatase